MSDEASRPGTGGVEEVPDRGPSPGEPGQAPDRKTHLRRGPTPAELALLRWLAAKPRPVTMGPIGHCVKRGWCEPVPTVVEDGDGRRPGFIYVVTEAGSRLIGQHAPEGSVDDGRPAAGAGRGDGRDAPRRSIPVPRPPQGRAGPVRTRPS